MKKLFKKYKLLIIAIAIYSISVVFNFWFVSVSFSKNGTRSRKHVDAYVNWSVFCPVVNTCVSLYFLLDFPPYKQADKEDKTYDDFYHVKK